jgi:hypothetical protein
MTPAESPTVPAAPAVPDAVTVPRPRRSTDEVDPERARRAPHTSQEYWDVDEACWHRTR